MADLLAGIIARKREEVAARLAGRSVEATPTRRSLAGALARPGARFIMEVKRRSPSGHRSAASLGEALAAYAPVADAISVLTDGPGFGGSLDDLRAVRAKFEGPILAKDFIVDPAQVSEARAAGADAVLVMMSVLAPAEASAVLAEARRLDMDAIVEVHDEAELSRALALDAAIVGINNRNLKTMTIALSVTERLSPLVPGGVLLVSESGIRSRDDVVRLSRHADAFLVGSSLMASPDIVDASRALIHGRVKLCGLARASDVELASRVGATHVGFILVPGSSRAVDARKVTDLAKVARTAGIKRVGVFRDAPPAIVAQTAQDAGFDAVQLHGTEDKATLHELRALLPEETEIWALCGVDRVAGPARDGADRTLFDTIHNRSSGGTGRAFNWDLLKGRPDLPRAFVAGGISHANAHAAAALGAYGLDVCSGVESAPGIKDAAKVGALFAALRPESRSRP